MCSQTGRHRQHTHLHAMTSLHSMPPPFGTSCYAVSRSEHDTAQEEGKKLSLSCGHSAYTPPSLYVSNSLRACGPQHRNPGGGLLSEGTHSSSTPAGILFKRIVVARMKWGTNPAKFQWEMGQVRTAGSTTSDEVLWIFRTFCTRTPTME